jgi:hypothetical protein
VLTGQWIERAEIGGPGEFDHLGGDELLAALRGEWNRSIIIIGKCIVADDVRNVLYAVIDDA